jgi:Membrane domain of glycerophosphoryl diester phosphodiesterase
MANVYASAPAAPGEFRIGDVLSKTATLLSRNFLVFFVVALVAALPRLLWVGAEAQTAANFPWGRFLGGIGLFLILNTLAQAVILYGAFQAMRGRPVNLGECLKVGLSRFFPIVGLIICAYLAIWIGLMLLIVPGIILGVMWYVSTPVCVVEQKGPLASLGRSSELTKGHRWKIFGMVLLLIIVAGIVGAIIGALLGLTGSTVLIALGTLVWNGVWGAFYAIFGVVTYHDLRVAKEGVDVHEIASVFD